MPRPSRHCAPSSACRRPTRPEEPIAAAKIGRSSAGRAEASGPASGRTRWTGVWAGQRSSLKLVEQERGLLGAVDRAQAQAALHARKGPSAALAAGPAARAPTRAANVSTASSSSAALSHSGGSAANTAEAQEEDCTAPEAAGDEGRKAEARESPRKGTRRDNTTDPDRNRGDGYATRQRNDRRPATAARWRRRGHRVGAHRRRRRRARRGQLRGHANRLARGVGGARRRARDCRGRDRLAQRRARAAGRARGRTTRLARGRPGRARPTPDPRGARAGPGELRVAGRRVKHPGPMGRNRRNPQSDSPLVVCH